MVEECGSYAHTESAAFDVFPSKALSLSFACVLPDLLRLMSSDDKAALSACGFYASLCDSSFYWVLLVSSNTSSVARGGIVWTASPLVFLTFQICRIILFIVYSSVNQVFFNPFKSNSSH